MTLAEFVNRVGFKVNESDVKKVNSTINSIKSTATKVLGAIGIGFSLVSMNALVEEFDAINDKINYTVNGLGDVKEAQRGILAAANAVKTSYSDMASVVTNLVKSNADMFPVDQAISFSTNLTKLMKSAGRNDSEIASIMDGMNTSFQKGAVDTETLNKMLEQAPETANYLADRLGVAKTQLLQLATDGKISVQDLKDAFVTSSEEIDAAFGQLNFGVSDALLNIRNKWGFWLKETDEMLRLTQTIGKVMVRAFDMATGTLNRVRNGVVWLTDKLGGTERVMKLLGIIVGAVFSLKTLASIMAFVKGLQAIGGITAFVNLAKAALAAKARILGLIAVIVIIALLVEDFINFMQGNDSVIGTLFERAGVDAEKFRNDIIQIWENVKTVLSAIWQGIKNVAIPVFQGIWNAIKAVFDAIGSIIEKIAPKFADFISSIASGKVDTAKWVELGETIAKIAVAIAGAVLAVKTVTAAVKTATSVVKGVSTAISLLTSPIGLVVVAIAAVIAIIAVCIKNWDKIKAAFMAAWEAIKSAWDVAVAFFRGIWDGIVGVFSGVVGWFSGIFTQAWEAIMGVFAGVGEFFQGVWDTIVSLFTSIGTAVGDAISGAVKGAINAVLSGAIGIINGFIGAINLAIAVINAIPGVKLGKLATLDVPKLAEGGYVRANDPRLAVVGDNPTQGEIVAPEGKLLSIMMQAIRSVVPRDTDDEQMNWNALRLVVSDLAQFVKMNVPTPSTTSTMVNKTSSMSVNMSNVFNQTFNGEKEIQQKVARAATKSSGDITSELARALAYAH